MNVRVDFDQVDGEARMQEIMPGSLQGHVAEKTWQDFVQEGNTALKPLAEKRRWVSYARWGSFAVFLVVGAFTGLSVSQGEGGLDQSMGVPLVAVGVITTAVMIGALCYGNYLSNEEREAMNPVCAKASRANPAATFQYKQQVVVTGSGKHVSRRTVGFFEVSVAAAAAVEAPAQAAVVDATLVGAVAGNASPGFKFCPQCGTSCEGARFCSSCGKGLQ